jgi:hypothetical protein
MGFRQGHECIAIYLIENIDIASQNDRLIRMKPTGESNPFTIPPTLLAEIQAEADKEHRPPLAVLEDAVSRYVREMRWQRTLAYGRERAAALGLTEEDVPRLIAESRREHRQGSE